MSGALKVEAPTQKISKKSFVLQYLVEIRLFKLRAVLDTILEPFWLHVGGLGGLLGESWAFLGPSWVGWGGVLVVS